MTDPTARVPVTAIDVSLKAVEHVALALSCGSTFVANRHTNVAAAMLRELRAQLSAAQADNERLRVALLECENYLRDYVRSACVTESPNIRESALLRRVVKALSAAAPQPSQAMSKEG